MVTVIVPELLLEELFVAVKEPIPVAAVGPEPRPIEELEFVQVLIVDTGFTLKETPFVRSPLQAVTSEIF